MNTFGFATAGRVLFGAGRAATELGPVVAGLGTRPLVWSGATMIGMPCPSVREKPNVSTDGKLAAIVIG